MADTLVERVTGQARADAVPVEVSLVMPHDALLADNPEPAVLEGYGPLPAAFTRAWLWDLPADAAAWVRRLYAHPVTDRLVTMDSRRRRFTGRHRALLVHRDQTCRTPWCDAPVRHVDHVQPHAGGGATSTANAGALRGLQPGQGGRRLAGPRYAAWPGRDDHSDRPHLPQPSAPGAASPPLTRSGRGLLRANPGAHRLTLTLRGPVVRWRSWSTAASDAPECRSARSAWER